MLRRFSFPYLNFTPCVQLVDIDLYRISCVFLRDLFITPVSGRHLVWRPVLLTSYLVSLMTLCVACYSSAHTNLLVSQSGLLLFLRHCSDAALRLQKPGSVNLSSYEKSRTQRTKLLWLLELGRQYVTGLVFCSTYSHSGFYQLLRLLIITAWCN